MTNEAVLDIEELGHSPALRGVDAIGIWDGASGLAEAARRAAGALIRSGVPLSLVPVDLNVPRDPRRLPNDFARLPQERRHEIALCSLNVNEFHNLSDEDLHPTGKPSYVIGSWYWELPELPEGLVEQARRVDEIWVTSTFVANAFRRYVDVPVTIVPAVVTPPQPVRFDRRCLGVEPEHCLFVFSFDARSGFARKNPWGLIEAFRTAFTPAERRGKVRLLVKCSNLDAFEEGGELLRYELDRAGGILINEELSAHGMASILNAGDVYVSLHRAEGFGLGMAEAMCLAKPVIATHYSGNVEFTTEDNSLPIPYQLRAITDVELRFNPGVESVCKPGMHWAEPDLDFAADRMRYCAENPRARECIGRRGATTVTTAFSERLAGSAMVARLRQIEADLDAP